MGNEEDKILKMLQEEAAKIELEQEMIDNFKSSVIMENVHNIIEEHRQYEENTIDTDYEEVKEEIYKVYNRYGNLVEVTKSELDSQYVLCEDGTYSHFRGIIAIKDKVYNIHTRIVEYDEYSKAYIVDDPYTYLHLAKGLKISLGKKLNYNNLETISVLYYEDIKNTDEEYVNEEGETVEYTFKVGKFEPSGETFVFYTEDLERLKLELDEEGVLQLIVKENIEEFKQKLFEKYPFFEDTIYSIFKDNWSIEYHSHFDNHCLVIYFEDLTITNSKGSSHKIKDLYVLLPFVKSGGKIYFSSYLYGGRGTLTDVEYTYEGRIDKPYKHSHLTDEWNQISGFCLGTGPIKEYLAYYVMEQSEVNLFSVLYNIKIYVEWESLEGNPYRRMDKLGSVDLNSEEDNISYNSSIYKEYMKFGYKLPVHIYKKNGVTLFKFDEEILEEQLTKVAPRECLRLKDKRTGTFLSKKKLEVRDKISTTPLLTYKGNNIYTKLVITKEKEIDTEGLEYAVHPNITRGFSEDALRRIDKFNFQKVSGINSEQREYYSI
jgi:hypothetical protein